MRRRMGDNALQNKPPCRMTGSKKGVRFNVTPPYAQSLTQSLGVVWRAIDLQPMTTSNTRWWRIFFISNSAVSSVLSEDGVIGCVHVTFLE